MTGARTEAAGPLLREGVERLHLAGRQTARLDAELLLSDALGLDRTVILAHPELPVDGEAATRYRAGVDRRAAGEPVAYIRGRKEFYGLLFSVDRRALIPRPETERLVELAQAELCRRLSGRGAAEGAPICLVDVGTGCGAIAVALAVGLRGPGRSVPVRMLGLDISAEALDLARENAVAHAVDDVVVFARSDLLSGEAAAIGSPFDLILANLPYVRSDALAGLPIAASFEPPVALDGGVDGLALIERLLRQLPDAMAVDGRALLEIGADQGELIVERCERVLPEWRCGVETDLAGLPRVARISRN